MQSKQEKYFHSSLHPERMTKRRIRSKTAKVYKKRMQCSIEKCKELGERHHPEYANPLEIIWLCKKHHMLIHRKNRKCSEEGCEKPHLAKSFCRHHYYKILEKEKLRSENGRFVYKTTLIKRGLL